jgi:hypothetical protein
MGDMSHQIFLKLLYQKFRKINKSFKKGLYFDIDFTDYSCASGLATRQWLIKALALHST